MKKIFISALLILFAQVACGLPAPTAAPQVQIATEAPVEAPTATTAPAEVPTATVAPVATEPPTVAPTAVAIILPQQWNGSFSGAGMVSQNTSLVIEEVDGNSLKGKMTWVATGGVRSVITNVEGEFVTDFSAEENRWNSHDDYKKGDKSGVWLKWTETSFVSGTDAILGGWYYGHAVDGKMSVIMFANDTDLEPYNAKLELDLAEIKIPELPAVGSNKITIDPVVLQGPHQWNGTYVYSQRQKISLIVLEVDDTTFKGQMSWGGNSPALTKMNGYFVTDFSTESEFELARWNFHEDYEGGDRSGTWVKWTETEMIKGGNYTMNGWYYAHIRTDGTLVGIYYFSPEATTPATDYYVLELKQ